MAGFSYGKNSHESGGFLFGTDLDDTLMPVRDRPFEVRQQGIADLQKLTRALRLSSHLLSLGTVTGRTITDHDRELQTPAFKEFIDSANFKVTSVGTAVHHRAGTRFEQDIRWPQGVTSWQPAVIDSIMNKRPELRPQPPETNNEHKLSYFVTGIPDAKHDTYIEELKTALANTEEQLLAQVIFSSGEYLDFLPVGIHKGSAYLHVIDQFEAENGLRPYAVAAGNSMNDKDFLEIADLGIIPSNADDSLQEWARAHPQNTYIAEQPYAAGILEGLQYAGATGRISFPG